MSGRATPPPLPSRRSPLAAWHARVKIPLPVAIAAAAVTAAAISLTHPRQQSGGEDDVVVTVEGEGREDVVPVVQEIAARLQRDSHLFHAVLREVDLARLKAKGLYYLSADELAGVERVLDKAEPIARGDWSRLTLGNMLSRLCEQLASQDRAEARDSLGRLADGLWMVMDGKGNCRAPWPEAPASDPAPRWTAWRPLVASDGRTGLVFARLGGSEEASRGRQSEALDALREMVVQIGQNHQGVRVGLTGLPVMASDHQRAARRGLLAAAVLAVLGVAGLAAIALGGAPRDRRSCLPLAPALAWGLGYAAMALFGMDPLGPAFGATLLGCAGAMLAIPMFMARPVVAPGRRELPALGELNRRLQRWTARPIRLLGATLAATVLVALGTGWLKYDDNLLHLLPAATRSADLEQRLLAPEGRSLRHALSMAATREEAAALKARFLAQPSVDRVEEVATLLPSDPEGLRPAVARIRARLEDLPGEAPAISIDDPADLDAQLARAQKLLASDPQARRTAGRLADARAAMRRLPPAACYARLADFQQGMARDLLGRLKRLRAVADPGPPRLDDLPEALVARFVGPDGRFLLRVYAKEDLWEAGPLEQFAGEVRAVDPRATGGIFEHCEASQEVRRNGQRAVWLAMTVVFVAAGLALRSAGLGLLVLVPPGLALILTLGLMGILGIPLNAVSQVALAVVAVLGAYGGLAVVQDYRSRQGRYWVSDTAACPVLAALLSAMVGSASLMVAGHPGLQALGRALTIGMGSCLMASLVVLPALANLASGARARQFIGQAPRKPLHHAQEVRAA